MADLFYENMDKTPVHPPLGEQDPPYVPMLYELRMVPGAKGFNERWFPFHRIKTDSQTALVAEIMQARLAEGTPQFTERLVLEGVELNVEWSSLGTTAACAVRQLNGRDEEPMLLLSGLDVPTDRAAIEAFATTIITRFKTTPIGGIGTFMVTMPRPMMLNFTRRPIEQMDGAAITLALVYFRHLGIVPE
jgi:hypothetical protein